MTRPPVPEHEPEPGHTWVPRPEGPQWRVWRPTATGHRCRAGSGGSAGRKACGATPVLAINRGRHQGYIQADSWWAYCAEHTYGRWVEDGQVWCWAQVPT